MAPSRNSVACVTQERLDLTASHFVRAVATDTADVLTTCVLAMRDGQGKVAIGASAQMTATTMVTAVMGCACANKATKEPNVDLSLMRPCPTSASSTALLTA